MVAKGKSMMEAEIDFQYQIFKLMLEQYPKLVQQCAEQWEQQIKGEAKANSDGDTEICLSMQSNHHLNETINLQKESIAFFENVMLVLIESYAESHLLAISQGLQPQAGPKLLQYYNTIQRNFPELPNIKDAWPDLQKFISKRNKFIHEFALNSKSGSIKPMQQLDYAYNLLSQVAKQINANNKK